MRSEGLRWNILYALALTGFLALLIHAPHAFTPSDGHPSGEGPCPLCLVAHAGVLLPPPPPLLILLQTAVLIEPVLEGHLASQFARVPNLRGPPLLAA